MIMFENIEAGDLKRLVIPNLDIDVHRSKMGEDKDICVICFTVREKFPADDLVNFIEKGYNYVLDADCSSGEDNNGDYQVFVEFARTPAIPKQIIDMIEDVCRLTGNKLAEWTFVYYKNSKQYRLTDAMLRKHVILSSDEYEQTVAGEEDELNKLRSEAGLDIDKKVPKNPHTESIKIAAGLL